MVNDILSTPNHLLEEYIGLIMQNQKIKIRIMNLKKKKEIIYYKECYLCTLLNTFTKSKG